MRRCLSVDARGVAPVRVVQEVYVKLTLAADTEAGKNTWVSVLEKRV